MKFTDRHKLMLFKYVIRYLLLVSLFTLFGCSNDKVNQPTTLENMHSTINIERVWKSAVGEGDEALQLQLSPVIVDDVIYTLDVDGELYALNRASGERVWMLATEEKVSGGLGADHSRLFYATFQGEIVCLDRHNGHEIWRHPLTSEAISAPASNGRTVVVQTIDGKLFAFDAANGIKRWRYDSVGPILSLRGTPTPLINTDYTMTSFANGEMLAFDNQTGRPAWKAAIGQPQGRTELERLVDPDGRATIAEDRVYAVAYQGKLMSLNAATGLPVWSKSLSSFNGVALGFSQVYVSTSDGEVVAVKATNSNEVWRNEKLKYRRLSTPVTFGNVLVVADFEGYLHFMSQVDGTFVARKRPDRDGVMGEMLVADDTLYVYTRSGYLVAYRIAD